MIRVSSTQHCAVHMKNPSSPFVVDPYVLGIIMCHGSPVPKPIMGVFSRDYGSLFVWLYACMIQPSPLHMNLHA